MCNFFTLLFFVVLAFKGNPVDCTLRCVVIAPRSVRSLSEYSMSITTQNATQPIKFRVKIYERKIQNPPLDYMPNTKGIVGDPFDRASTVGPKMTVMTQRNLDSYSNDTTAPVSNVKTRTITVDPNVPQIVKFNFDKDLSPGSYVLEVQSLSTSESFYEKQFLYLESATFSIFVQSNRASYRPGDVVKYRILVLDVDTRPIVVQGSLTVSLYDADGQMIHQVIGQSAQNGIYLSEFQTTADDKRGIWTIEAGFKGKRVRKTIELTQNAQPNFQVAVKAPQFVANTTTNIAVAIEAFYTFGKPVYGTATITATPILKTKNTWSEIAQPLTVTKDIRGTFTTIFRPSEFKIPANRSFTAILLETVVKDLASGYVARGFDKTVIVDETKVLSHYYISLSYFGSFLPNSQYTLSVEVRARNGLPLPHDQLFIDFQSAFDSADYDALTKQRYTLDANGKTDISIMIPASATKKLRFKVMHGNVEKEVVVETKALHVQMMNFSNAKIGQKIQFQVGSAIPLASIFYYVVGRGNILLSQVVDFGRQYMNGFEIDSTPAMAPASSIVVFYVTENGTIVSDETEIKFAPKTLLNPKFSVSLSETKLKPNQELTVTIETDPNSHVSLVGLDQNTLLTKRGHDLTRARVYNELRSYDNAGDMDVDVNFDNSFTTMLKPGTIVMTNARRFMNGKSMESMNITKVRGNTSIDYSTDLFTNIMIPVMPLCKTSDLTPLEQQELQNLNVVRSRFSDNFLWQDNKVGTNSMTTTITVPETITSWSLSGFALNPTNGLGILKSPLIFTTFKPFFVNVLLPSIAKLGAPLAVVVVVHNYLDETSIVEVNIDDKDGGFAIISEGRNFFDYENLDADYELRNYKQTTVQVLANGVKSTSFTIVPKKLGTISIKVQAVSKIACDSTVTSLIVEPAGVTISRTVYQPLLLSSNGPFLGNLTIDVPQNVVAGSVKTKLTLQGDKYTLDFVNLRKSVTEPSGSGGDFLTNFLDYATNVKATPTKCPSDDKWQPVFAVAQKMFDTQCSDGGYRLDADCDQPDRDTTYSALVTRLIYIGLPLGYANPVAMFKGFDWLARTQRPDGSFADPRPYPSTFIEGPITTAYVAYVILDGSTYLPGLQEKYNKTIELAMTNLFNQLDNLDLLSLSIFCRAAQLRDDPRKGDLLTRLTRKAFKNEESQKWIYGSSLYDAAPYIMKAFRVSRQLVNTLRVANGLAKYRVEIDSEPFEAVKGVTYNGLLDFYEDFSTSDPQVNVTFSTDGQNMVSVLINKSNRFLLNRFNVGPNVRNLIFTASGRGFANLELTYQYNLKPEDVVNAYDLQVTVVPVLFKEWQLHICVSANQSPAPSESVMEISFPPGFNTTEYVQDLDPTQPKIKQKDLKGNGMIVHFAYLDSTKSCFTLPLYRQIFVNQLLTGSVVVYDKFLKNERPHWSRTEFTMPSFDKAVAT